MIRSEKQHQAAKKQLASLREALALKTQTKAPEVLVRAAQGQTAELAGEIEKQIKDYEQLQKRVVGYVAQDLGKTRRENRR